MTHVRPGTLDDLDELCEMDRVPRDEMAAILGRSRILLAEDGPPDGVIGWLRWGLFWDEVPFMNRLHVVEHRRRDGVGRLLVEAWEGACRGDGHTTVLTSTMSAEQAQHFYRRLGYTDAGALFLPDEPAEIFFVKRLG